MITAIEANRRRTILLCGVTLLVATGLGFLTTRWISRPMQRLSQGSQNIAQGNWQVIPENTAILELQMLANSFKLKTLKLLLERELKLKR